MLGTPNVDRVARRRSETRQEILDAAWAVVAESGWSGLTQRAVAERVGMRAPSLYTHFASKLDIVDAMYGQAWQEYNATITAHEADLPDDPRAALFKVGPIIFDTMAADPARYVLMNQRPVPGFVPTEESYRFAVETLDRLRRFLARIGATDPDALDLFTALTAGLVNQQLANDPGGDRWRRLVPRVLEMYADEIGLPGGKNR